MNYYSKDGLFLLKLEAPQVDPEELVHAPTGRGEATIVEDNHNCTVNFSPTIHYAGSPPSWINPPGLLPQRPKHAGTDEEAERGTQRP